MIGGSPCQDLSIYKEGTKEKAQGLEGKKSSLFYHYVRALKEVKPKYFLLENVASMKQEWSDIINEELGVEPITIDSQLVCAALRNRKYWTNIPNIQIPNDKGIILSDIVLPSDKVPEKYWIQYPFQYNGDEKKVQCTLLTGWKHRQMNEVYNLNGKCNTLCADGSGGSRQKKIYQDGRCRKLTPLEYERLQTLPDGYTEGVADSHRYTAIGNGWTVDVIAHIFTSLKEEIAKHENQIKFNNEESFNEIVKACQKGSDSETKEWISFNARLSTKDTFALCEFLNSKGIEYKAV